MSVAEAAAPVPSRAAPALSVERIGHSFGGKRVLDDVTFTVPAGCFTILLGLNGTGKTTLFSLITRLYHGTSGTIRVFGHDMRREPLAALAQIGVVFQQPTLELDLSVEQNLFYHASLHGLSRAAAAPRIAEELARAGLAERRRDMRQLSGGQRRRVELARALIHDPRLLLLDEPTVGLDVRSRALLLDHVRALCAGRNIGVLWATHLVDEVGAGDQVIVRRRGRVVPTPATQDIEPGPALARLLREDAPECD
jgi:ABC-2 type transport system ATP-binding protein